MQNVSIVIGGMFGDEGKGHMSDYLCNNKNTLNIRFNGGAQASHTVVTPDGKRHAFRHFGSGTFVGAKTYLSRHYIVNPFSFALEREKLIKEFSIYPVVYVNPQCLVTTFWDMYINQAVEELRGKNRHGSCGYGINETVERSKHKKYLITVKDLIFKEKLKAKLKKIRNKYVPYRLKKEYGLRISDLPMEYQEKILDSKNIEMSLFFYDEFLSNVRLEEDYFFCKFDNLVFEGAQGLLLDQNNKEYFPNVTTSNTGIENVMEILKNIDYKGKIDIYYMSRCYATRHGAGDFKSETLIKPYPKIVDLNNVRNKFQGSLRFGYLDFNTLCNAINKDLEHLIFEANINVVITCIDQIDSTAKFLFDGGLHIIPKEEFCDTCKEILKSQIKNLNSMYIADGLTRDNIVKK